MYRLYDYYEGGKQLIFVSNDWFAIMDEKRKYIADTDGECDLEVESYGGAEDD